MSMNSKEILEQILDNWNLIDAGDVPNIPLYMDQVTTFMDGQLKDSKRYPEDKILTKTMINNYAKNDLLPPPEKKKYSKEHVLMLVFIYWFKNTLSIQDIKSVLEPISDKYFNGKSELQMEDIYTVIRQWELERMDEAQQEMEGMIARAGQLFAEADVAEEEKEFLEIFSLVSMLSFDICLKKQLMERLIDNMTLKKQEKNEAVKIQQSSKPPKTQPSQVKKK